MNMQKLCKASIKRAMSLILTVCMLFSLLPAGVITPANDGVTAAAASEHDLYFNMLKAATDAALTGTVTERATALTQTTYAMTTKGNDAEVCKTVESDPWEFFAINPALASLDNSNYIFIPDANTGVRMISAGTSTGTHVKHPLFIRFKVKVENGGYYLPYAKIGCAAGVSRAMSSIHKYEASSDTLGEVVMAEKIQSAAGTNVADIKFGHTPIKLDAGEYVITIGVVDPSNDAYYSRVDLRGYGLSYLGATDPTLIVSGKLEAPVEIGKTVNIPLSISAKDGTEIDVSQLSLYASSSDDEIAMISYKTDTENNQAYMVVRGFKFGSTPPLPTWIWPILPIWATVWAFTSTTFA